MKKSIFVPLSVLCVLLGSGRVISEPVSQSKYIEYLAGIELLCSDKSQKPQVRKIRYQKLCEITGVSASLAKEFVLRYRDDPSGWQKVLDSVAVFLSEKKK